MAHAEAAVFGPAVAAGCWRSVGLIYSGLGGRVHRRAVRARPRRGGQLPGRRSRSWPSGSRSASARSPPASSTPARTSARWSRRWSCRSSPCTWGWYWAFIATGALGFLWLVAWWVTYASPEHASARVGAAELALHPQRPAESPVHDAVAHAARAPADVGLRARQVPDRPGVVALPVLGSGLPAPQLRHQPRHDRAAAHRDLSDRRRRQHRRRVAVVAPHQARAGRSMPPARRPCWRAPCRCCRWCSRRARRTCGSPSR